MEQLSDLESKTMLQLEHKSVRVLEEIICNFTNPGDLVLYECCRFIAPETACLLLQQHPRIIGRGKYQNCVAGAMGMLLETFPENV